MANYKYKLNRVKFQMSGNNTTLINMMQFDKVCNG